MVDCVESSEDLNETKFQEILRNSLSSPNIQVISVKDPGSELCQVDQYGSDLKKMVVLVRHDEVEKEVHMIAKSALTKGNAAKFSKLGMNFHREAIWFKKVLPMLLEYLSPEQTTGLLNIVPKCHYSFTNYEDSDLDDCMFRNIALCFCCILYCKKSDRGFILMENLKERPDGKFIDMKEIEKKGITVEYMRLAVVGLAHFHGAWWLWLEKADEESKKEILSLYKTPAAIKWKWLIQLSINMFLDLYIAMFEARKEDPVVIEKLKRCKNSPSTVENVLKCMHDFDGSKYKTMIHWDLWTAQVMFSHNPDGTPRQAKILDYQTISPGHPASDIWGLVYACTDSSFRKNHLEDCLKSYFSVLSDYMAPLVDVSYEEFKKEVDERRFSSPLMVGGSPVLTLSPRKRPSIVEENDKCVRQIKEDLCGADKDDDHPDLKEMRRRILDLVKESVELELIK